jgi:cysteine desulfurase
MKHIYLDHAATTPLDPRVLDAMMPYLTERFGNASSVHSLGRKARFAVEESREKVATLLGAEPGEIVFTSGGTEADNTVLKGGVQASSGKGLLTSAAEHEAVLRPAEALAHAGVPVHVMLPDASGAITPGMLRSELEHNEVGLVSIMHANNEIGTLSLIAELAQVCHERGISFHTDAVQTAGLFRLDVRTLGVDFLSLSAHKFYGPKGVGLLYVRAGQELHSLIEGGSQERRRRGGTENVPAIVGLMRALELASSEADARLRHLTSLRARLVSGLQQAVGSRMVMNTPLGDGEAAPHVVNIAFPPVDGKPVDGEMLLLNLDMEGVSLSAGSACTSGALEPSHVLIAIGLDRYTGSAALRFSLGKDNSEEEIDVAIDKLELVLKRMRVL